MKDRDLLVVRVDPWADKRKDPNRRNGSWVHDPRRCLLCIIGTGCQRFEAEALTDEKRLEYEDRGFIIRGPVKLKPVKTKKSEPFTMLRLAHFFVVDDTGKMLAVMILMFIVLLLALLGVYLTR